MSDDQGDAEFEASLANLDVGDQGRADVARGDDEAGVSEVRRLFAGLHEDLLQIRAIARSIAERDVTDEVRAVRSTVDDLAARDVNAPVRDELAGLRDMVVAIQTSDPVGQLRSELEPLRDGLDHLAARLADDSDHRRLLERIDGLETRLHELAAADRSDEVLQRLDSVSTSQQVRGLAADLRAHLADALGGLDGDSLSAEMAHVRGAVDEQSGAVADALQRLQETLLDLASGEVVGALWDEFRALRDSIDSYARAVESVDSGDGGTSVDVDALAAGLRDQIDRLADRLEPDDTAAREAAEGTARTSADVRALSADLNGAVAEIRAVAAAVDRLSDALADASAGAPADQGAAGDTDAPAARAALDAMAQDLAALRTELHDGLVVEPSDDLTGTLEALQAEIDGLRSGLDAIPAMQSSLDSLRDVIAGAETAGAPAGDGADSDAIRQELGSIRTAVEAVQAQLDEGLVLADDVELPTTANGDAGVAVADQIASLRDHVSTELDGLRAAVAQRGPGGGDAGDEGELVATIDPDTIDLLREEIRSAGGVSDQVVDALREELKALRRRLAVKAQEKVLSDEQLALIAEAVVERLEKD